MQMKKIEAQKCYNQLPRVTAPRGRARIRTQHSAPEPGLLSILVSDASRNEIRRGSLDQRESLWSRRFVTAHL